jgi:signal recognition particle receptor subunit beta
MSEIDRAYQARFTEALMEAIMTVSIVEEPGQPRAAFVRSGEVIDSMLSMIALLSSTSLETKTPAKTRALCDQLARKLQRLIATAQRSPVPFETINSELHS